MSLENHTKSSAQPNIYLVGMPGSGKSAVGVSLARKLRRRFVDLDELIEQQTKRSITAIIQQDGEPLFRKLEASIVSELAQQHNLVVATGGGTVLSSINRDQMLSGGLAIHLTASAETLTARLNASADLRPLLKQPVTPDQVKALWETRKSSFAPFSQSVSTNNLMPAAIATQILAMLSLEAHNE